MESQSRTAQFLTFHLAEEIYGIEVRSIREILEVQRITPVPRSTPYLLGVINVRGRVVPVVDLRVKFGLPSVPTTVESAIVILERSANDTGLLTGVLVDSVAEVLTIDGGDIQPPPSIGTDVDAQLLSGMGRVGEEFVLLLKTEPLVSGEELEVASSVPM